MTFLVKKVESFFEKEENHSMERIGDEENE